MDRYSLRYRIADRLTSGLLTRTNGELAHQTAKAESLARRLDYLTTDLDDAVSVVTVYIVDLHYADGNRVVIATTGLFIPLYHTETEVDDPSGEVVQYDVVELGDTRGLNRDDDLMPYTRGIPMNRERSLDCVRNTWRRWGAGFPVAVVSAGLRAAVVLNVDRVDLGRLLKEEAMSMPDEFLASNTSAVMARVDPW